MHPNSTASQTDDIARNPRELSQPLKPIAEAGPAGLDLAQDADGRWWAIPPVVKTSHQCRFSHRSAFHLIDALNPALARRWQSGELDELLALRVEHWLNECARQREVG